MPEQFRLFLHIWQWCCSNRSGIWQYYENLSVTKFAEVDEMMNAFGLTELAQHYRTGMMTWEEPDFCGSLDAWIDAHWEELENAVFELVKNDRQSLY